MEYKNPEDMTREELVEELLSIRKAYSELLEVSSEALNAMETMMATKHPGGRPCVFSEDLMREVAEYKRSGATFRDTAAHFGISVNTVQRFCKKIG